MRTLGDDAPRLNKLSARIYKILCRECGNDVDDVLTVLAMVAAQIALQVEPHPSGETVAETMCEQINIFKASVQRHERQGY